MLGRTADLVIHAHPDLEGVLQPQINYYCADAGYKVVFEPFNPRQHALIYEDRSLTVTTIPLRHRMPCCGFLFAEKRRPNHIIREMVDFYQVPVYELNRIKNGADYVTPEGKTVSNNLLTRPSAPSRSYAYCSDTIYLPSIVEQIKGVDLLFHEATFANEDAPRAKETFHTTAAQAAEIARRAEVKKLLIGHFSARYEDENILLQEASAIFPDTQLAKETLCVSV
jgi:ribonuclease Z